MYLHGIETRFNCPKRNLDHVEQRAESTLSVFAQPIRLFGRQDLIAQKLIFLNMTMYIGTF